MPGKSGDIAERRRVGATLAQMRELRGVTHAEMAEKLGISRPYLSNIEAGRKRLTPALLVKAAETLHVTQISILADEDPAAEEAVGS